MSITKSYPKLIGHQSLARLSIIIGGLFCGVSAFAINPCGTAPGPVRVTGNGACHLDAGMYEASSTSAALTVSAGVSTSVTNLGNTDRTTLLVNQPNKYALEMRHITTGAETANVSLSNVDIVSNSTISGGVYMYGTNLNLSLDNSSILTNSTSSGGIYLSTNMASQQPINSTVTLQNSSITTHANLSTPVALNGGGSKLVFSKDNLIVSAGDATPSNQSFGVYITNYSQVESINNGVLRVNVDGSAFRSSGQRVYGILVSSYSTGIFAGSTVINASGFNAFGARTANNSQLTFTGDLSITANQGTALHSTNMGAMITVAGANNEIVAKQGISTQWGESISNGALASDGGKIVFDTNSTTSITTEGDNVYGIQIQGKDSVVDFKGNVSVSTSGVGSYGLYLSNKAVYTLDGSATRVIPNFKVSDPDTGILGVDGTGTILTLKGQTGLGMPTESGLTTWGGVAQNLGNITLTSDANIGGLGLWAKTKGSLSLGQNINLGGSHIKLTEASSLALANIANNTTIIGSLEGSADSVINPYTSTLIIGKNNDANNGSIQDDAVFSGKFNTTTQWQLTKQGNYRQILNPVLSSSLGSITVSEGSLKFMHNGVLTIGNNYETQAGATTELGAEQTYLKVNNRFTQAADSILDVVLNNEGVADIQAKEAYLGGRLDVRGFSSASNVTQSDQLQDLVYTFIHTTNGIYGDFVNDAATNYGADYLMYEGVVSPDQKDYNLLFSLSWNTSNAVLGTGNFTVSPGSTFEVNEALETRSASFNTWDGNSLTKLGEGTLILSEANAYTGSTTIGDGRLSLLGAGSIANSSSLALTSQTSIFDLSGVTGGTVVKNLSGEVNSVIVFGNQALTVTNDSDTVFSGVLTGTGGLIKEGSGDLTLTGASIATQDQTYTGTITINTGSLTLKKPETMTANIENNSVLNFNQEASVSSIYSGQLSGMGQLNKLGAGTMVLTSSDSVQTDVSVDNGTLSFLQSGIFNVNNNYTTKTGATTELGATETYLRVGGTLTQQANSTLTVTLNNTGIIDIKAQDVSLDGYINVRGFNSTVPVSASEITNGLYTLIESDNPIQNQFINDTYTNDGSDYLLNGGQFSVDRRQYLLGFKLAWMGGTQATATGTFTLNDNTSFDVDEILSNNTNFSTFDSGWDGKSLIKQGNGLLVLSAQNQYDGSTSLIEGTLRLGAENAIASSRQVIVSGGVLELGNNNQTFNRLTGEGGQLSLAGSTLTLNNPLLNDVSSYTGSIVGAGHLYKTGLGELTLSGELAWDGETHIQGGTLTFDGDTTVFYGDIQGDSGTRFQLTNGASLVGGIDPTDLLIASNSTWTMTKNSQVHDIVLEGTLSILAPTASDYKTLIVDGDYTGQNGLLIFNTRLGDDSSVTDRLIINGNTSGTTQVLVNNMGGVGQATINGIELISVLGNSDAVFAQRDRIVAGAYEYSLVRGTGAFSKNWYLTSQLSDGPVPPKPDPLPDPKPKPDPKPDPKPKPKPEPEETDVRRPEAGSYLANLYASQRLFNLRWDDHLEYQPYSVQGTIADTTNAHAIWVHTKAGQLKQQDDSGQLRTAGTQTLIQLGGDLAQWQQDKQQLVFGVMAGYGSDRTRTESDITHYRSWSQVNGYNLGVYGYWTAPTLDRSRLYIDTWAHYSWLDNTVNGQGQRSESYDSNGATLSIEAGGLMLVGEAPALGQTYWLRPQAQLIWTNIKADDHREYNGTWIKQDSSNTWQTRLGLRGLLETEQQMSSFLEINWLHNSDLPSLRLDDALVKQAGTKNLAELRVGIQGQVSKTTRLSGDLNHQWGQQGFQATSIKLNLNTSF